jgi:exosortase K
MTEQKVPFAKLIVVVLAAVALKQFYSAAGSDDLRWILTPTTFLVELATGEIFNYEANAGYINQSHSFLIAPACAGVNFLITAFLLLVCSRLAMYRIRDTRWSSIPFSALISYVTTIVANAFRISIALMLPKTDGSSVWVAANQLHRLEGIVVYFGFLVILFIVSESLCSHDHTHSKRSASFARQLLPPLLTYYSTTIGVPLFNGAFHGSLPNAEFWEYALFVVAVPAVLIAPIFVIGLCRRSSGPPASCRQSLQSKLIR